MAEFLGVEVAGTPVAAAPRRAVAPGAGGITIAAAAVRRTVARIAAALAALLSLLALLAALTLLA